MTGDNLIEKYGPLFGWDPTIALDSAAMAVVDRMLGEISAMRIAADYRISALRRDAAGHLEIDDNILSLSEGIERNILVATITEACVEIASLPALPGAT